MPRIAGVEQKYALKKATVWGTAVPCGAGNGFLALPTGIRRSAEISVDDSQGLYFSQDGTPGAVTVEGDLPLYLRYDGCDLLLALFMGIAGAPALHAGATAAYDYTYDMAEQTDGLFATFAKWMKNYVSEVPGLKIAGLTLSGERGQPVRLVATCIGDNMVEDGANTVATFSSVTVAETMNRVRMADGVFRMNDRDAIALGGANEIYPSSFELSVSRNLSGVYTGEHVSADPNPQDLIDEPTNNGPPTVTLRLQFPQHTGKTYLTDLGSDTRKKMDITFTGAEIEPGIPRTFKLQLPHLQLRSDDVVDEAGIIKEPLEFIGHGVTTESAGMTGITAPLRISGTNRNSANPLA